MHITITFFIIITSTTYKPVITILMDLRKSVIFLFITIIKEPGFAI